MENSIELLYSKVTSGQGMEQIFWGLQRKINLLFIPIVKFLEVYKEIFSSKEYWCTEVPRKVAFFLQMTTQVAVDNLWKRNILVFFFFFGEKNILVLDWCCMCKNNGFQGKEMEMSGWWYLPCLSFNLIFFFF